MSDPQAALKNHNPQCDYFIAIDSDGCAFDTMEIKHKECFIPNIIKHWKLQAVSKFARDAAEFVNLYSKWRGINRFPALTMTFDLLEDHPDVKARKVEIPKAPNLRRWIETETKLGNPALVEYCARHNEPDMHQALRWSKAVNDSVADLVEGVPPFPFVRECLQKMQGHADVLVCSATPLEALEREWEEHDIAQHVFSIAGQEQGSKKEHIQIAAGGKYDTKHMLMIGDAPGDMKAARGNNALFFPINPGAEAASWERLHTEALDKFFEGTYAGAYETKLIQEFESYLPDTPPWKKKVT
jgi:phosphoglycolate phosphatase-like HAD superfamily hydrolase